MAEWANYAINLSKQLIVQSKNKEQVMVGSNLAEDDLKLFKEDQIVQLYELSQAATGRPPDVQESLTIKDSKSDS